MVGMGRGAGSVTEFRKFEAVIWENFQRAISKNTVLWHIKTNKPTEVQAFT